MDIKLKKYSHHLITKVVVFILVVLCFSGFMKAAIELEILNDGNYDIVFEDNYFQSSAYIRESEMMVSDLTRLIVEFKSEKHILSGATISEDETRSLEENLYSEFRSSSRSYNPELSEEKNYETFKVKYAEKITQAKDELIKNDLREFHSIVQNLEEYQEPFFYVSDGENDYVNRSKIEKGQVKSYPSYMIFEKYTSEFFPKEVKENEYLHRITENIDQLDPGSHVVYIAYTEDFLNSKIKEWKESKVKAVKSFYFLIGNVVGFILLFIYLIIVIGRSSFKNHDQKVHLLSVDKIYNDLNLVLGIALFAIWVSLVEDVFEHINTMILPITIPIASVGLLLVLALVKHSKNKTIFKHTVIYTILYKLVNFVGAVYRSGGIGVKTVLIVIGYPILVALTFFMFPVTLGFAAWFAFKKIKSFQAIKEGVERIKDGDIHHSIHVKGHGEFSNLAKNINSITDGLKTAVASELKSERLKTELITNVSHDIRNPLTSIISYVDLLKVEKDPRKIEEYIDVLDQKSNRLKILTDDLFEAAKASSGNIPVTFEQIDIISLVNQGLGEVSTKIEALDLDFKLNVPEEKVFVMADGKLLWRSMENLLSNIFKYALRGSRVYIDIEDLGNEVLLTFKNISAFELNISADELMERFKRGDESRLSQGSGLGLSIAKSLISIQKGDFSIQIDGDLFKAMIYLPKYKI